MQLHSYAYQTLLRKHTHACTHARSQTHSIIYTARMNYNHRLKKYTPGFVWGPGENRSLFILLIYCWLIAQSTAQSPQGFSQVQISHTSWIQYKTCTLHKRKTYKHNPKGSPFGIALVKNDKKLGDAGTIDNFGLAFQYQINIFC